LVSGSPSACIISDLIRFQHYYGQQQKSHRDA
jgi:hypothetical protein